MGDRVRTIEEIEAELSQAQMAVDALHEERKAALLESVVASLPEGWEAAVIDGAKRAVANTYGSDHAVIGNWTFHIRAMEDEPDDEGEEYEEEDDDEAPELPE